MGAITTRFQNLINEKKAALAGLQGQELIDATAEVIYLDYTFKKRIKDTNDKNVWDRKGMSKIFEDYFANDKYKEDDARKARLNLIKGNIPGLLAKLDLADPNTTPLPEVMYEYALNPDALTDEKMVTLREQMYKQGVKFNLFKKPQEGFTPECQKDAIEREMGMLPNNNGAAHEKLIAYCNKPEIREKLDRYAERLGLLADRANTHVNTFKMYLIAKKNMSFKDTHQILPGHKDFDNYFNEFLTFLRDHPVKPLPEGTPADEEHPQVADAQQKENARIIFDMFNKCGDYCANYRIPDIDYSDLNAVAAVQDEFSDFQNFMQDYGQQLQMFQKNDIVAVMPEENKLANDKIAYGYQIVRFAKSFSDAYQLNRTSRDLETNPSKYLKNVATNRELFARQANTMFRGKTGADLLNTITAKDIYAEQLPTILSGMSVLYTEISDDVVSQYLRTGDGRFAEMISPHIAEETERLRTDGFNYDNTANALTMSRTSNDRENLAELKKFTKAVFGDGSKSVMDMHVAYLTYDQEGFAKAISAANVYYAKLLEDDGRGSLIRFAGVEDPMSLIKIDGKSIEERWPDFATLNAEDKKELTRLAVLNEIFHGESNVTIDTFAINERDELVAGKPYLISTSPKQFERIKDFLREVDNLHGMAGSLKNELDHPKFTVDENLTDMYNVLKTNLENLGNEARLRGDGDMRSLTEKWKEFNHQAELFYNSQINMIVNHDGSEEQLRAVETQRMVVQQQIAEQYALIVNKSKGLEDIFTPGEFDNPAKSHFCKIKDKVDELASNRLLSPNRAALHGEVAEPLPEELQWFSEDQDIDETIPDELINKIMKKAGFRSVEEEREAEDRLSTNLLSMRNTDYSEIIGEGQTMDRFFESRGISIRMTGQSIFMFYCMGKKNMSVEEAVRLTHAHDMDENGNYIDEDAHKNALAIEKDFVQFVKDYPMEPGEGIPLTKQQAEQGAKEWVELYAGFYGKIKEFRWPDIDYSDPNQVKDHFEVLYALQNLLGDGYQEVSRFTTGIEYNKYVNIGRVAETVMGSEENFWKMHQFFSDMQCVVSNGFRFGYSNPLKNKRIAELADKTICRAKAGKFMSTYAGKTIGQAYEENVFKTYAGMTEFGEAINLVTGHYTYTRPDIQPLNPAHVVQYLFNQNKNELLEWEEQYAPNLIQDEFNRIYPGNALELWTHYRSNKLNDDIRSSILSVDDRPESMIAYLNNPSAVGEKSGKDVILGEVMKLVSATQREIYYRLGLKESDLFLVNGKTAEQLWGRKYANVNDPVLKENLYRAEIVKAVVGGKDTISVKAFSVSLKDKSFRMIDPVTVMLPRVQMEKMVDNYFSYRMQKDNLLSQLEEIKTNLTGLQKDDSSFGAGDVSDEYLDLANALNGAIGAMSNYRIEEAPGQFERIKAKYNTLVNAVNAYKEKNKDTKDPVEKERLYHIGKIPANRMEELGQYREVFNSDLMESKTDTIRDANEKKLFSVICSIKKGFTGGLRDIEMGGLAPEEDEYVRGEINTKLKELKDSEEYKRIMSLSSDNAEKKSLQYLEGVCEEMIRPALPGEEKRLLKYADLRYAEDIMHNVPKYTDNLLFQKYMTEDPNKTIKTWPQVEAGAKLLQDGYKTALNMYKTNAGGSIERYIAGLSGNADPAKKLSDVIRENKDIQDDMEREGKEFAVYERLAQVVWLQILSRNDEVSKQIREGINQNPGNYDKYLGAIQRLFMDNGVLSSGKKATKAMDHLESGRLQDDTLKILQDSAWEIKNSMTERENQELSFEESLFEFNFRFLYQRRAPLSAVQFSDIMKVTGISDEKKIAAQYFDRGRLLKSPITYSVDGEMKTIEAESGPFNRCEMGGDELKQNTFILYLMSEHDMNFETAFEMANRVEERGENNVVRNAEAVNEANTYRAQFYQFVKANPVKPGTGQPPIPDDQLEQAYGNWSRVFINATEKIKSFRIPEIDYRNKEEVKENMALLTAFSYAATNTPNHFRFLFRKQAVGMNPMRVFKEVAGGEEKLREFNSFWAKLSTPMTAFHFGFIKPAPYHDGDHNEAIMVAHAGARYFGTNVMQEIKGKTAAQAAEYAVEKGWTTYLKEMTTNPYQNIMNASEQIKTSVIDAVKYLSNLPSTSFIDAADNFAKTKKEEIQKNVSSDVSTSYATDSVDIDWADAKQELIQIPDDDAQGMMNFLENEGHYTKSNVAIRQNNQIINIAGMRKGKDFLCENVDKLFGKLESRDMACEQLGIKKVDLILIDGQTPSEKWKEKYANVQDTVLKEQLLFLEVFREIALGRSDIFFRTFAVKDDKFTEIAPLKAFPKRDAKMVQVYDNVHSYGYGVEEILAALKTNRDELAATQSNRRANFYSQDGQEGYEKYRKYTKSLMKLIRLLEKENAGEENTKKEILDGFDALIANTDSYYSAHSYSLRRGLWSKRGRDRKNISRRMVSSVRQLKEKFLDLRKTFETDYLTQHGTFKDAPYNAIKKHVDKHVKAYNLPKHDDNHLIRNYQLNKYISIFENFLKKEINVPEADQVRYGRARKYLQGVCRTAKQVRRLSNVFFKTPEQAEEFYHNLAKNPVFQHMMNDHPRECISRWSEVEERQSAVKQGALNDMEGFRENHGSELGYILDMAPVGQGNPAYTMQDYVNKIIEKRDEAANGSDLDDSVDDEIVMDENNVFFKDLHKKAAEVILNQILTEDTEFSKNLSYAITASDVLEYREANLRKNLLETIEDNMLNQGLFFEDNFRDTLAKIENRRLAKDYAAALPELYDGLENILTVSNMKTSTFENIPLNIEIEADEQAINMDDILNPQPVPEEEPVVQPNVLLNNPMALDPEPENNLLENPKPKVVPFAIPVFQPVMPENGEPRIQQAEIPVQIPIENIQEIPVIEPIILPAANENVPKDEIIDNGLQIVENKIDFFQMVKPQPQIQPMVQPVQPKAEPKPVVQPKPQPQPKAITPDEIYNISKFNNLVRGVDLRAPRRVYDWRTNRLPNRSALTSKMQTAGYDNFEIGNVTKIALLMEKAVRHGLAEAKLHNATPEEGLKYLDPTIKNFLELGNNIVNFASTEPVPANPKIRDYFRAEADGIVAKFGVYLDKIKLLDPDTVQPKPVKEEPKKDVKKEPKNLINEEPKNLINEEPKNQIKNDPKKPAAGAVDKTIDWMSCALPTSAELDKWLKENGCPDVIREVAVETLVLMNQIMRHGMALALQNGDNYFAGPNYLTYNQQEAMNKANSVLHDAVENKHKPENADQVLSQMLESKEELDNIVSTTTLYDPENPNKTVNKVQPKQNRNNFIFNSSEPKSYGDYVSDADMNKVINKLSKNTVVVNYPRNKWEFPLEKDKNSKVAKNPKNDTLKYFNTGDIKMIEGIINKPNALSPTEKEYFKHHLAANKKLREKMKKSDELYKQGKNPYPGGRLPVITGKSKGVKEKVEILLTKQNQFQTSEHGCWSCSAALLLQGRGINDVTQEDIRLFRSADKYSTTPVFNNDAHRAYNYDKTSRIIEAGDLLTRLAPDSMLKDLEIRERPLDSTLTLDEYKEKAVDRLGKEIFKAINFDKSPVSFLRGGHYVTITGIRQLENGEYEIKYKNSVHDERFAGKPNPDREVWENLSDAIGGTFAKDGGGVSISWMADIKMDAQGHILNAPRDNVFVDKNGNLDVSKDSRFAEAENLYKEERMQNGRLITKSGEDENDTMNIVSAEGLSICESAYVNKQLNFDYLHKRGTMSAMEKEVENAKTRLKTYGPIKNNKSEEYTDKLRCIMVLASAATVKFDKSLQGKDANEKAQNAFKKVKADKNLMSNLKKIAGDEKGENIIKRMETGELIGVKQGPALK